MNITNKVNDFILNWESGMSTNLIITNLEPSTTIKEINDLKSDFILYINHEELENYTLDITFNISKLEDYFRQKMKMWSKEKQIEQEEYWRSIS